MMQENNTDASTRFCPCGSSCTWSGYDRGLEDWMREHLSHSNGYLKDQVGSDWHRVYGEKPEARMVKL